MGGALGIPEMPMDDINRIAKEVLDTFVPLYVKSYAILLMDKLKAEADPPTPVDWHLRTPPIPAEPLLEGWLTKLGAVKQNWKRRYFVATNEADNFRIYYFEKEEQKTDPSKKKGEIQPCGYRTKELTKDEEKAEFGDFAFTLKPYGRRRQWYIRADNADDLKNWTGVTAYAAQQAKAPLNPDPVMAGAFMRAYRMTRWRLGVWGWYSYDRTEEELLSQMIVDRCERDCMGDVYAKIPGGRLERKIRKQVQDMLDQTVGAAVGSVWKATVSTIESKKDEVEGAAKKSLGELFEKQAELKNKIKDAILGVIQTPLDNLTKPVMTPICNCLMGPLTAAYKELMCSYHARMQKIIEDGVKEEDLKDFVRDIRYWWGVMRPALRQIYKAFRDGYDDDEAESAKVSFKIKVNIGDIVDMLHGVSAWQIEYEFEKSLRRMMGKAIFTFASELEEKKSDPTATLNETMGKFLHDSRLQITRDVQEIFRLVLAPVFSKMTKEAMDPVLSPFADMIPEPMKMFLDIEKMANTIMDEVLDAVINSSVEGGSTEALSMLDSLPSELGFAA